MKSILISIKPKWVAKILNGEKTIEIRKTMPKCDLPIDVYIYATKRQNLVLGDNFYGDWVTEYTTTRGWSKENVERIWVNLSGKVVAKFTLNKVEEIDYEEYGCGDEDDEMFDWYFTKTLNTEELQEKSCLKRFEIANYLQREIGYAWLIDNLEIFDEPKELSEFRHICELKNCEARDRACWYCGKHTKLTKAPQSWCYVEKLE